MTYTRLSAAEAAAMIKDQDTIALSGFTPNGVPKATFREYAAPDRRSGAVVRCPDAFLKRSDSVTSSKLNALASRTSDHPASTKRSDRVPA